MLPEGRRAWDRIWKAAPSAAAPFALEEQVCPRGSGEAGGGGISGNVGLGHQPLHCYQFLLEILPLNGYLAKMGWSSADEHQSSYIC